MEIALKQQTRTLFTIINLDSHIYDIQNTGTWYSDHACTMILTECRDHWEQLWTLMSYS